MYLIDEYPYQYGGSKRLGDMETFSLFAFGCVMQNTINAYCDMNSIDGKEYDNYSLCKKLVKCKNMATLSPKPLSHRLIRVNNLSGYYITILKSSMDELFFAHLPFNARLQSSKPASTLTRMAILCRVRKKSVTS